jgi:hypothetical protein
MTPETEHAPAGYGRRPRLSPRGADLPPGGLQPPSPPGPELWSPVRDTGTPVRSTEAARPVEAVREAGRTGQRDAGAWPPPPSPQPPAAPRPEAAPHAAPETAPEAGAERARADGSIVGVIPYLVVLVCTIAGVYVAWHQGSAGGGKGGVVGGIALLVAAVVRLVLPARLVGLLGTRSRAIDVLTLTIFGGGLLIAGLVLPR